MLDLHYVCRFVPVETIWFMWRCGCYLKCKETKKQIISCGFGKCRLLNTIKVYWGENGNVTDRKQNVWVILVSCDIVPLLMFEFICPAAVTSPDHDCWLSGRRGKQKENYDILLQHNRKDIVSWETVIFFWHKDSLILAQAVTPLVGDLPGSWQPVRPKWTAANRVNGEKKQQHFKPKTQ